MMERFTALRLGNNMICHGYDTRNKEIVEEIVSPFSNKVVTASRIKSVSEKYVLTNYLDGRWILGIY